MLAKIGECSKFETDCVPHGEEYSAQLVRQVRKWLDTRDFSWVINMASKMSTSSGATACFRVDADPETADPPETSQNSDSSSARTLL